MKMGKKQAGAEMCQAHIKLWFDLACLCLAWHMFGLGWLVLVGCGLAWFGIVWYTCKA